MATKQMNIIIMVGILVLITATSGCMDFDPNQKADDRDDEANYEEMGYDYKENESYVEENEPYEEENEPYEEDNSGSSSSSGESVEVNPYRPKPTFNSEPED